MTSKQILAFKQAALDLNLSLVAEGLVALTWGNASIIDRETGLMAIKPSGVPYQKMQLDDIVLVGIEGSVSKSKLKPSTDTPTHIEIYKGFPSVNSIIHTHSVWATIWAQAGRSIPSIGTTHADHFSGDIPCLAYLSASQVRTGYEKATGTQIINFFESKLLNPIDLPACLLSGHGSFVWGSTHKLALENAIALERCAFMAYHSLQLNCKIKLPQHIREKHFSRKNGSNATYGQIN